MPLPSVPDAFPPDNGSQFLKWDGWDYGSGNPEGNQGNDPYNIDDDVTDTNGLLKYSAGTGTAHRDTKTYTYTRAFAADTRQNRNRKKIRKPGKS